MGFIPQISNIGGSSSLPANNTIQRVELACAPSDANVVYAFYHHGLGDVAVFKTTSGAPATLVSSIWDPCTDPQTQVPGVMSTSAQVQRDLAIIVDPNNKDIIYIGSLKVARGEFTGSNAVWTDITTSTVPHVDIASMEFYPQSSTELYACTDGGIYKCKNPATAPVCTYNSVNLNITQFNSCAMNNTTAFNFLAGAHDNGTLWLKNASGISNSEVVGDGDGLSCFMGSNLTTLGGNDMYKMVLSNNSGAYDMNFHTAMHKDAFLPVPNFNACSPKTLSAIGANTVPIAADLDDENHALITKGAGSGSLFFIANLNNTSPNCNTIASQTVAITGMAFNPKCIKVSP